MNDKSRSPLKDKPLRVPGQSLEEERRELLSDKLEPWLLMSAFLIVVAALDWWRYLAHIPLTPGLYTSLAGITVVLAIYRFVKLRPRLRALKLGMEGERAVGQHLEELRVSGYSVYHDVIAPGFNVDHVLIGPAGVFAVETKTWAKPAGTNAEIHFEGEQLKAGSLIPDRDPVVQAQATARWLCNELLRSTGKELRVRPVVLFPGWFVRQSGTSLQRCWVLEPKAFQKFLAQEPDCMSPEDIKLASYHLSRMVRVSEQERAAKKIA